MTNKIRTNSCFNTISLFIGKIEKCKILFIVLLLLLFVGKLDTFAQMYPQNNFMIAQPTYNYMANSSTFRQEIARMEINVVRAGKNPISITQVPRLEKDDIVKVRLLDEAVNSMKPDQSNFDWTFLIAFINPSVNNNSQKTVTEEINFKKRGWYKEYAFAVPYDSQPIFFLYPKPNYRSKILNLVSKKQEEIKKIGEKTLEIADAYAKIGSFLNELQGVVNRNYYRNLYNGYTNNYNGIYGSNFGSQNNFGYNDTFLAEQAIERIARSFNIQMPSCWNGNQFFPGGGIYNNQYNNGYNNNNYGGYTGFYGGGMGNDFMGKVQCLARTVRVEDFDISVGKMIQQGGIYAASQLAQKYPQIAFWINIAAAALDFIIKLTNKAPLRIVPTVVTSTETQMMIPGQMNTGASESTKISLFAEAQPNDNGFVTAYPMVFHKWQPDADPNLINLPMPVLMDSCLHAGQNIIRTTDVVNDWMTDNFTKDFQLNLSTSSGYQKDFNLKKNVGLGGWELNLTKEDLASIPKIDKQLVAKISGKRGFNRIQSPDFIVQMTPVSGWSIEQNSQNSFTVGGKRVVALRNSEGNCRCLETLVYKPSFGGEYVFDSKRLAYSPDNKEVAFEIDTTNFPAGTGQLELRQYGGDTVTLNINLFPPPPSVVNIKIAKGDSQATLVGERIEQVKAIRINGKRAIFKPENGVSYMNSLPVSNIPPTMPGASMNQPVLNEKTFVFEEIGQRLDSNNVALELELGDQRIVKVSNTFNATLARPVILTSESKEVEAFVINREIPAVKIPEAYSGLPVFPIETSEIGVNIQNALTDFDFKIENLRIETKIENTQANPIKESDINFEVLDWRSIRLNILISNQTRKMIGGRRIQFRIVDAQRGSSDWYSIRQSFVRIPQISSIKCLAKECEVIGKGINYIQQISLDDGKTWMPQEQTGLNSMAIANGLESAKIPNNNTTKKIIRIKLRDFPSMVGIPISIPALVK